MIDETLFGASKNQDGRSSRGARSNHRTPKGSAVVSSRMVSSLREDAIPGAKNTVMLSSDELGFMQNQSVILTAAEKARRQKEMDERKNQLASTAKARKERMLQMEDERKKKAPVMSPMEEREMEQKNALLEHARQALDEELDDVKHMNQMMLYAKCATIRDAQLAEKVRNTRVRELTTQLHLYTTVRELHFLENDVLHRLAYTDYLSSQKRIAEMAAEEEKRLDWRMESDRLRALQVYKERERIKQEEQKVGAQVIIRQIQEREAERLRQQELREQEAQAMIERIKELEIKEEQEKERKVLAGRKLLEQVMEANNAQARAKLRKKQEELEEDLRIAEYIKNKEAREAAAEAELERIKAEKEKEVARLRAMQEKAQDRQSQMDELRAKRYQEANDRAVREKERKDAERRDAMRRDIAHARDVQRREKIQRMADQAVAEREEYHRTLEWQRTQAEIDAQKAAAEEKYRVAHREELLKQITAKERRKVAERQKFLDEGKTISKQMDADKRKLLRIKAQKLALLQAAGVPEKYQAELSKKKVSDDCFVCLAPRVFPPLSFPHLFMHACSALNSDTQQPGQVMVATIH